MLIADKSLIITYAVGQTHLICFNLSALKASDQPALKYTVKYVIISVYIKAQSKQKSKNKKEPNVGLEMFVHLTLSQATNFRLFQTKKMFTDENFKFNENCRKFFKG